ncbi:hypothetical protein Y1Q_0010664 [Alligator mississippiensis]|uniref:Uncharacterized protein n=1 Tax=Alligator mississippiensis TaxID=8496 RepID=A0A151M6C1_ALLMI|nr:hypothetical protein Y1Q_0010664 [Alligator mississippiensis]
MVSGPATKPGPQLLSFPEQHFALQSTSLTCEQPYAAASSLPRRSATARTAIAVLIMSLHVASHQAVSGAVCACSSYAEPKRGKRG